MLDPGLSYYCSAFETFQSVARRSTAKRIGRGRSIEDDRFGDWHLDSGANVLVVPAEDPCIVPGSINKQAQVTLHSTTHTVSVPSCLVDTPIGRLPGLAVPDGPRLIPTDFFEEFHSIGNQVHVVHAVHGGAPFAVRRGDTNCQQC